MSRWKTYSVVELRHENEEYIAAIVTFDPEHPVYGGHFPGQPVTPGVILIGMLRDLVQLAMAKPLMMTEARTVKFHQPLKPVIDQRVSVEISYQTVEPDVLAIKATVSGAQIKYCSLNARYRIES